VEGFAVFFYYYYLVRIILNFVQDEVIVLYKFGINQSKSNDIQKVKAWYKDMKCKIL
jgi:hypothetical protein